MESENDEPAKIENIKSSVTKETKSKKLADVSNTKQSKSQARAPFNAKSINAAPQVILNAKDERVKDIDTFNKGTKSNMKTMASTGNVDFKETKQVKPEETKKVIKADPSEKSLVPLPMTNPFTQFYPKSEEEKEVELLDDNIDDNEDDAVENDDPNQSHEINPTVFPVGFPF